MKKRLVVLLAVLLAVSLLTFAVAAEEEPAEGYKAPAANIYGTLRADPSAMTLKVNDPYVIKLYYSTDSENPYFCVYYGDITPCTNISYYSGTPGYDSNGFYMPVTVTATGLCSGTLGFELKDGDGGPTLDSSKTVINTYDPDPQCTAWTDKDSLSLENSTSDTVRLYFTGNFPNGYRFNARFDKNSTFKAVSVQFSKPSAGSLGDYTDVTVTAKDACDGIMYLDILDSLTDARLATVSVQLHTYLFTVTDPSWDTTVKSGSTAAFSVTASGPASYQWQYRKSDSGTWTNVSSAREGYNAATLKVTPTAS